MRVAIIGTGNIARMHARFYQSATREPMEFVACADVSEEARTKFAADFGVPKTYGDYRAMLQESKPDMVSICTWHGLHCEMTLAAVESGARAVLCEKPIAVTLEEADRMIAAAKNAGVLLAIDHQLRCAPEWYTAHNIIASGKLGTIKRVTGICTPGYLVDNGTHTVDLMRYLMQDEPVEWVMGQIDRRSKPMAFGQPSEDWAIGYWSWQSGARGLIEAGRLFKGDGYHHITVNGEDGDLDVRWGREPVVKVRTTGGWEVVEQEPSHNPVDEMVAALAENRPHRSSGEQGRASFELLMAIYESVRRRGVVELPLTTGGNPLKEMVAEGIL